MMRKFVYSTCLLFCFIQPAAAQCPIGKTCLSPEELKNPHSRYGSPYSSDSATNPYASQPPKLYDSDGNYQGKLSTNKYDPDSTSNPYGRYGNPYSPDSINNPYGAGNPYSNKKIYVVPGR